jgi:hypothetical protein
MKRNTACLESCAIGSNEPEHILQQEIAVATFGCHVQLK